MKNIQLSWILHPWAFLLLALLSAADISAQQTEKIQLRDQSTSSPIVGARYQYASQSGLSDEAGFIMFRFEKGAQMTLSHLLYGKWAVQEQELKSAMQAGFLVKEEEVATLYPVTIIALRSQKDVSEAIQLDYQDKMAHDGGALLNRVPVINSIRKSGNYGFDPVLRGFKYDQLNIVFNGIQSATAACPNRMDPPTSQMAPNMIDRIEILKGPHALRYGNSFGGTINFISSKPRFTDQKEVYGRLSGGYESNGDLLRSEGLIGFSGANYDLGLFASWSQGNDYIDGDGITAPADFSRGSFGSQLGLKLSPRQQLTLLATRNLTHDADFPALAMDLRKDDTWMLNARHTLTFDEIALQSWQTTLFGTFVDHLMDNGLKPLDPRVVNAEMAAKTLTYGGRTEGLWRFPVGKLYAGADYRAEEAEGFRVREFIAGPSVGKIFYDNGWQNARIQKSGLFAEYHLRGKSLQWVFSGRLELNHAQILDAEKEFTEIVAETANTQVNPALSVGSIKSFGADISIGLWLGRAQRSGSLIERFINHFPVGLDPHEMVGNPELDPEINNQVDLTFEYRNKNTTVNVDVFGAYIQNNISSVIDPELKTRVPTSPGVRRFINIDEAVQAGFEISWNQNLFAGLQHQLSLAYTYGKDLERKAPLPEIAPLDMRYTLFGKYLKEKLQPEITLRHVLQQDRISTEFGETVTPDFTLLDVALAYHFSKLFRVSTGVQNLLDEAYYEHLSRTTKSNLYRPIHAPGRNFFVSLSLDFM